MYKYDTLLKKYKNLQTIDRTKNNIINKQKREIERLNNIINELEHYLKVEKWKSIGGIHLGVINGVLDKLQRLKGSDKE